MGRTLGFTGTSAGADPGQLRQLEERLAQLRQAGFDEFHHGLCVGADEQAAAIAKRLGFRVVAHPGLAQDPANLEYRSAYSGNDAVFEAKPFAHRDRDIVDAAERVIAAPSTRTDEAGSGTWAAIRYAYSVGKPVDLILHA